MASSKRALAVCDICGFTYSHRNMKMNSYGLLVCPTDYDGAYDLKNHPQNKTASLRDEEFIKNPRPPAYTERNRAWEAVNENWEDLTTSYWNTI
jgi:hypothetical protein|tara:strand:- start:154 stop:435 length:282 start_codon:yes stop_codon:yes gene_type:complete